MNPIQRAIASARQRLLLQRSLDALGWLLLGALGVVFLLLVLRRTCDMQIPWWAYVGAILAALLVTPVIALRHPPGEEAAAALIDQRLGLQDRLVTALYAAGVSGDPFARVVLADAQKAANKLELQRAFPVRPGRAWIGPPILLLAILILAVALGQHDALGLGQSRAHQQMEAAQAAQARAQLEQATQAILSEAGATQVQTQDATAEKVRNDLASLSQEDLSTPEARQLAAAKVATAEEELDQAAGQKQAELDRTQNAMSRLDPGRSGPADKFVDAMRRGDYAEAQQELNRLGKSLPTMSQADRQALKEQMTNLSKQMEEDAKKQGGAGASGGSGGTNGSGSAASGAGSNKPNGGAPAGGAQPLGATPPPTSFTGSANGAANSGQPSAAPGASGVPAAGAKPAAPSPSGGDPSKVATGSAEPPKLSIFGKQLKAFADHVSDLYDNMDESERPVSEKAEVGIGPQAPRKDAPTAPGEHKYMSDQVAPPTVVPAPPGQPPVPKPGTAAPNNARPQPGAPQKSPAPTSGNGQTPPTNPPSPAAPNQPPPAQAQSSAGADPPPASPGQPPQASPPSPAPSANSKGQPHGAGQQQAPQPSPSAMQPAAQPPSPDSSVGSNAQAPPPQQPSPGAQPSSSGGQEQPPPPAASPQTPNQTPTASPPARKSSGATPPLSQGMQQALQQLTQQLSGLSKTQQDVEGLRQSQGKLQQVVQNMAQPTLLPNGPQGTPNIQGTGISPGQAGDGKVPLGAAHRKATFGSGHEDVRFDTPHNFRDYATHEESDQPTPVGQAPGSTVEPGGVVTRGEVTVAPDLSVPEARAAAERAVTEDRVPGKYHQAIRQYFDQMSPSAGPTTAPSSP